MNDTIELRRTELEKLQVNEEESESNDKFREDGIQTLFADGKRPNL